MSYLSCLPHHVDVVMFLSVTKFGTDLFRMGLGLIQWIYSVSLVNLGNVFHLLGSVLLLCIWLLPNVNKFIM
jgi:hypothetical protein